MVERRSPISSNAPVPPLPHRGIDPGLGGMEYARYSRPVLNPSDEPALLFSGGLDSLCMWFLLDKPRAIHINHNAPWHETETWAISALKRAYDELWGGIASLGSSVLLPEPEEDGHIPFRNLLLIMNAVAYGYDALVLGALAGETSRDKSDSFLNATSKLLSTERPVRVVAPFRRVTKTELVGSFIYHFPAETYLLTLTRSCYASDYDPSADQLIVGCGRCLACIRRWVAMYNNGIEERYICDPPYYISELYENTGEKVMKYGRRLRSIREVTGVFRNHRDLERAVKLWANHKRSSSVKSL